MLFRHKKEAAPSVVFDPALQEPMLKASICTGETVAGFRAKGNGRFDEVMLIRDENDLKRFMDLYGLTEKPKTFY